MPIPLRTRSTAEDYGRGKFGNGYIIILSPPWQSLLTLFSFGVQLPRGHILKLNGAGRGRGLTNGVGVFRMGWNQMNQ